MSDRNLLDAVAAALRRDLTDDEKGAVDHLAVGAAALIRGHLGQPRPPTTRTRRPPSATSPPR